VADGYLPSQAVCLNKETTVATGETNGGAVCRAFTAQVARSGEGLPWSLLHLNLANNQFGGTVEGQR